MMSCFPELRAQDLEEEYPNIESKK